ncbi:MAG TPA: hypothetical protein VMS93_14000, partial [Candidatus Saccharimonadales bacterium]|nr:hypothetical protein [Candidatus Saccharimonadales bacterium]
LALALAGLLALGAPGCGSTTQPTAGQPPKVAGSYLGAVVFPSVPGSSSGDTLPAALDLAQNGSVLTGTWRVWASSGTDSVWGSVQQGRMAQSGSPPAWQASASLQVARAGCAGGFTVTLVVVSLAPSPGWSLQGAFAGTAPCFRGGGAQSGEMIVISGLDAPAQAVSAAVAAARGRSGRGERSAWTAPR